MFDINMLITPIAIMVSAGIGYWASDRTIKNNRKQEEKFIEKKRTAILKLLKDEIEIRWKKGIQKDLASLYNKNHAEAIQIFADSRLSDDDLFIFKSISTHLHEYTFIGNPDLISEIVHGYVLIKDLIDLHINLKLFLQKEKIKHEGLDKKTRDLLNDQNREKFESIWNDFDGLLSKINIRFDVINEKI